MVLVMMVCEQIFMVVFGFSRGAEKEKDLICSRRRQKKAEGGGEEEDMRIQN
jgi:hypothetical protein